MGEVLDVSQPDQVSLVRSQRPLGADDEPDERPAIRGPLTYAGPGSLGGTESALRR